MKIRTFVLSLFVAAFVVTGLSFPVYADDNDDRDPVTGFIVGSGECIGGFSEGSGKVMQGMADGTGNVLQGMGKGAQNTYEGIAQSK